MARQRSRTAQRDRAGSDADRCGFRRLEVTRARAARRAEPHRARAGRAGRDPNRPRRRNQQSCGARHAGRSCGTIGVARRNAGAGARGDAAVDGGQRSIRAGSGGLHSRSSIDGRCERHLARMSRRGGACANQGRSGRCEGKSRPGGQIARRGRHDARPADQASGLVSNVGGLRRGRVSTTRPYKKSLSQLSTLRGTGLRRYTSPGRTGLRRRLRRRF